MIYGLSASAMGVLANSYRQDVIANNLANVETVGFKKDLAQFVEMKTAARQLGLDPARDSNPMLEELGGGMSFGSTAVDLSQGDLETTGTASDAAIQGEGFFAVNDRGQTKLTRDGRFFVNSQGHLALISGGQEVLDQALKPISVTAGVPMAWGPDGSLLQKGQEVRKIGVFDVPNREQLVKQGRLMFSYPNLEKKVRAGTGTIRGGVVERSNVDSAAELAQLMDSQRQLDANANMIRYQDATLQRLVNDVGKIS